MHFDAFPTTVNTIEKADDNKDERKRIVIKRKIFTETSTYFSFSRC